MDYKQKYIKYKNKYINLNGGYRLININDPIYDKQVTYIDDMTNIELIYDTRSNLYVTPISNKQISQIMKYGNIYEQARLFELLGKYLKSDIKTLVAKFECMTYDDVYKLICNSFKKKPDISRGSFHAAEMFRKIKHYVSKDINNYLDIGCGDGNITTALGKLLKAIHVHCIEVFTNNNNNNIEYFYIDKKRKPILSYPDKYFDVITAFMSLHHIVNLSDMVDEIYRILKPDGILIIKEHDCWNSIDAMLIYIEHNIYIKCQNEPFIGNDHVVSYKNYTCWDTILLLSKYSK